MIISDLSVLEAVEESANIQGGDTISNISLPLFVGFPAISIPATNNASASAAAQAQPFISNTIRGVSVSNTLAQTQAVTSLGGGSSSVSLSIASISFVPGPGGIPLLLPV